MFAPPEEAQLSTTEVLLGAVISYVFILLCNGYTFGSGDQSEVIPFLDFIPNADYHLDFFVQNYLHQGHGIRAGIIYLSQLGTLWLPLQWWYWILHFLSAILLLSGLLRIYNLFTSDRFWMVCAVVVSVGILYGFNLGSNEIYYPAFIGSTVSNSLLIWAIYFYFRRNNYLWPAFILPALYFQELAALQVWLILSAGIFWLYFTEKRKIDKAGTKQSILWPVLILCCLIVYLKSDILSGRSTDIMRMLQILTWRTSHHFLPGEFGLINYFLIPIPAIIVLVLMKKEWPEIRIFLYLIILGCLVYSGLYKIWPAIMLSQWFKSTMWLKVIVFGYLTIKAGTYINSHLKKKLHPFIRPALSLALLVLGIIKGPATGEVYEFPFLKIHDDEKLIAIQAQSLTPGNSLFLIPPQNSTFKIWSGRSCYVDYKSVVADDDVLIQWMNRIHRVYGIGLNDPGGMHSYPLMEQNYKHFIENKEALQKLGITHILTDESIGQYKEIVSVGKWNIYKIK
jgi:hypothetical protein